MFASDCTGGGVCSNKKCVGGPLNNNSCANGNDCNGCTQPSAVGSCAIIGGLVTSPKVPLNGVCIPRSSPPGDVACVTNVECKICVGGPDAGRTCTTDAQCRLCQGGTNPGTPCTSNANCTGGGTCPAAGPTCTGAGTCQLDRLNIVVGTPDVNDEATLTVPQASVILAPAVVPGIGTVCVGAGGDGLGVIDCDGGRAGLNIALSRDHNTSPQVCLSGDNAAKTCTTNADCPNAAVGSECNLQNAGGAVGLPDEPNRCKGGTNDGTACTTNAQCTGGGTCQFSSGNT